MFFAVDRRGMVALEEEFRGFAGRWLQVRVGLRGRIVVLSVHLMVRWWRYKRILRAYEEPTCWLM